MAQYLWSAALPMGDQREAGRRAEAGKPSAPAASAAGPTARTRSVEEAKGFWRPSISPPHVPVDVTREPRRRLDAPEDYAILVSWRVEARERCRTGCASRLALRAPLAAALGSPSLVAR
jgi:hypothetical protein